MQKFLVRFTERSLRNYQKWSVMPVEDKEYIALRNAVAPRTNIIYVYDIPELGNVFTSDMFIYIKSIYEPKYKNFVDKLMEIG